MTRVRAVIFDWGNTLMRDLQLPGPMAFWPRVEVVEGVVEALEILHRRLWCCVASGAGESDAELMGQALERANLRRYFRDLWTARELGASKPEPAFYRAVLERLAVPAATCVVVGDDYERDIVLARAAGMRTVWLAQSPSGDVTAADAVIDSMADLVAAVEALGRGPGGERATGMRRGRGG